MDQKELNEILEKSREYWAGEEGGELANLRSANLRSADLQDADLQDADLWNANLWNANLRGADLRDADLRDADLRNADLWGADLRNANLWNANLRGADLRGADLDFSCWPLWCGTLGVRVDKRIAAQLAYHFCRLDCSDPEYMTARNAILDLANQFHRVDECGRLVPVPVPEKEGKIKCAN